jgi:hypothetical protein
MTKNPAISLVTDPAKIDREPPDTLMETGRNL